MIGKPRDLTGTPPRLREPEHDRQARNHIQYTYNPDCKCAWCSNGGKPPKGYWTTGMYGEVYCVTDSFGNAHRPKSRSPFTEGK